MTNLAEHLVQVAGVPFREAHEFASRLTDFGRQHGLTPTRIAYADAARVYGEHASAPLPLSEAEFLKAIDPIQIIASRAGRGGPQRVEVERLLAESSQQLADDTHWLATRRQAATDATATLDQAFARLL
jgi:argininosuccinate lyase